MAEPLTLYKLMILSMLECASVPLTNTILADFFLEKGYTTYFTIQEALHELNESQFILQESSHNNMQYSITPAGLESLHFFEDKINPAVKADIRQFISDNQISIKEAAAALADFYKTPENKYAAHCQIREKNVPRLDLTITVASREQAETICNNWKKKTDDIYALLMDQLLV